MHPSTDNLRSRKSSYRRNRLRLLYIALCAFQLLVTAAGLLAGYGIEKAYSSSIANEVEVNAQRRELAELSALADAATPPNLDTDQAEWKEQTSSIQNATTLFISRLEKLIEQPGTAASPLGRSTDELRVMIRDMGDVVLQVRLAADSEGKGTEQIRAHLMYADRALARVRTHLGNVSAEALKTRDEILNQQAIQARRVRPILGPLSIAAGLLVIPAVLYARSLDKQARAFESELQAERDTLEVRVKERTAELRIEIERRNWMEEFNRKRNRVLEMVAGGGALRDILEELASAVEHSIPGARCIVVVEGKNPIMAFKSALPAPALTAIMQALTAEAGLMGRLRREKHPLFLAGLDDRTSSLRAVVRGGVVQALWAIPVMTGQENVAGALMLIWASSRVPETREEELLLSAARVAGIASAHTDMQEERVRRARQELPSKPEGRLEAEDGRRSRGNESLELVG